MKFLLTIFCLLLSYGVFAETLTLQHIRDIETPIVINESSFDMFASEDYTPFDAMELSLLRTLYESPKMVSSCTLSSNGYPEFFPVGKFFYQDGQWRVLVYHTAQYKEGCYIELLMLSVDKRGCILSNPIVVSIIDGITNKDRYCKIRIEDTRLVVEKIEI